MNIIGQSKQFVKGGREKGVKDKGSMLTLLLVRWSSVMILHG